MLAREVGAGGDEHVDLGGAEGVGEPFHRAEAKDDGRRGGIVGQGDDAGEGERVGGVAREVGGEVGGLVVPAQDGDALAEAGDAGGAGEKGVGGAAPGKHEREHEHISQHDEPARDGRIEAEDEGETEVGGEPETGALDDEIEGLEFSQEEAFLVEAELGEGGDEERGAEQQEREVERVGGVGHVEADGAHRGLVTQPVAEGEPAEGHEGVTHHQQGGEDDLAQTGGGRDDGHAGRRE